MKGLHNQLLLRLAQLWLCLQLGRTQDEHSPCGLTSIRGRGIVFDDGPCSGVFPCPAYGFFYTSLRCTKPDPVFSQHTCQGVCTNTGSDYINFVSNCSQLTKQWLPPLGPLCTPVTTKAPALSYSDDNGSKGSATTIVLVTFGLTTMMVIVCITAVKTRQRHLQEQRRCSRLNSPTMIYSVTLTNRGGQTLRDTIHAYVQQHHQERTQLDSGQIQTNEFNVPDIIKPPPYEEVTRSGEDLDLPPPYSEISQPNEKN